MRLVPNMFEISLFVNFGVQFHSGFFVILISKRDAHVVIQWD